MQLVLKVNETENVFLAYLILSILQDDAVFNVVTFTLADFVSYEENPDCHTFNGIIANDSSTFPSRV